MKNVKFIITIIISLSLLSAKVFGQVKVEAQVNTSEDIYVGQSFRYLIIIDGDNKPGDVDLAPLALYNPQSMGNQDISQTSMTFINNKVSKKVIKRYVMGYSLTINRPGQIKLPSITVTVDGKEHPTNSIQLNILQPGTTDELDFDIVLSEQKCYVGQPVIMTVKFYVSSTADIGEFQFNLPALTSDSFFIEEPEITDPQAKLFRLQSGMTVNVSQRAVQHNGRNFILVSLAHKKNISYLQQIPNHLNLQYCRFPNRTNLKVSTVSSDNIQSMHLPRRRKSTWVTL